MTFAMFIVGVLFGIVLALTLGLFAVMSMDGKLAENFSAVGAEIRLRLTGHNRKAPVAAPVMPAEHDAKIRTLQEELRMTQRLMDKQRTEREEHAAELQRVMSEVSSLRAGIAERDEKLAVLEEAAREQAGQAAKLRDDLGERSAELAKSKRELKDLETEMSVVQSKEGLSAVSEEIARLCAERDELIARLERFTKPAVAGE